MATENPTWGYTRIRGGLKHLGHDIARNTIKAILNDHGIEPAPQRRTKMPWKTLLAAHWDGGNVVCRKLVAQPIPFVQQIV